MAVVVAAYLACLAAVLATERFDITRFITAGDHFVSPARLRYPIAVAAGSDGYDGQFFYRLALDPLSTSRTAYGISLRNHPAVRAQRIVYPGLAWAAALGRGVAIPVTLVAVNLLALAAMAWLAAGLAAAAGMPARLGLLIPFYPGFVLSLCRDTAEIVATALALAALRCAGRARWAAAALCAGAAVLTRETTLPCLAGYGLVAVAAAARRRRFDARVGWCLVPLLVYPGWQLWIERRWGAYGFETLDHDDVAAWPLVAYAKGLAGWAAAAFAAPVRYSAIFSVATCLGVAGFAGFVVVQLARARRIAPAFVIPWCLYLGLTALLSQSIWRDAWGFVRVLCEFWAFGILALIAARRGEALRRLVPFVAAAWVGAVAFAL